MIPLSRNSPGRRRAHGVLAGGKILAENGARGKPKRDSGGPEASGGRIWGCKRAKMPPKWRFRAENGSQRGWKRENRAKIGPKP